jgi:hypothetical protein
MCTEDLIRVDDVTESPEADGRIGLLSFVLTVLAAFQVEDEA